MALMSRVTLIAAAVVVLIVGSHRAKADSYSCSPYGLCPYDERCDDDLFRWDGPCQVQCMHLDGGQTFDTSSARCENIEF